MTTIQTYWLCQQGHETKQEIEVNWGIKPLDTCPNCGAPIVATVNRVTRTAA